MVSHLLVDVVAVACVLGFGTTVSAASVVPVISAVSLFPKLALPLWLGASAWMATDSSAEMQLPLHLLFTTAVLQRCNTSLAT